MGACTSKNSTQVAVPLNASATDPSRENNVSRRQILSPSRTSNSSFLRGVGWTPLHEACINGQDVSTMEDMLVTFHSSVLIQDAEGRTPLQLALLFSDDDVVFMLLRNCPKATFIKDNNGQTALLLAISRNRSKEIVREILIQNPNVKLNRRSGKSPMHFFCLNGSKSLNEKMSGTDACASPSEILMDEDLRYIYDVLVLLLKASVHRTVTDPLPDAQQWLPLHASLRKDSCSAIYIHFLLKLHPGHARIMDKNDTLPIHIAVTSQRSHFQLYQCHKCCLGRQIEDETSYENYWDKLCQTCFYERYLEKPYEKVDRFIATVNDLLDAFPGGLCIPTKDERLPLSIAAEFGNQYINGIERMFRLEPMVIGTRDIKTHMYPFMLAAVEPRFEDAQKKRKPCDSLVSRKTKSGIRDDECILETPMNYVINQFTTCFNLLMEDPSIIKLIMEDMQ